MHAVADYPTSLDDFPNPTPTDFLNDPDHAAEHSDVNDAVETLETKVGLGASAPTVASQVLKASAPGESEWDTLSSLELADVDPADTPTLGEIRQYDGTKWVSVTVPLLTNLIWEGDDPSDSSFLDPN